MGSEERRPQSTLALERGQKSWPRERPVVSLGAKEESVSRKRDWSAVSAVE